MTAAQVYEQAIKPLSAEDKLAIARLILNEVVQAPMLDEQKEYGFEYLKRLLPSIECISLTQQDLDSIALR